MTATALLPPDSPFPEEDEIRLTDLLLVLLKRKRMIILLVALAIVGSVTYSLTLPKIYTATARILPPQTRDSGLASILSEGASFAGVGLSMLGVTSSADVFIGILESRTVADMLISKFNLHEVYKEDLNALLYLTLAGKRKIAILRKSQIISISVDDKDPKLAAEMANAYVDALDQVNRNVNITEGHRKRLFLETRLDKVKKDLVTAETALKDFQEKNKLIAIDAQSRAAIEGASRIKGEIIVAQTELEVLKHFGTERQNEAIMLSAKIAELENQLARIETGRSDKNPQKPKAGTRENPDFYIPFSELPELGLQLARLTREAKVQEKVFELLTSQYELAKIEEAKDVNTIQVLDRAVPPDRKSGPKRAKIVIMSTVVVFFLAVLLAFFLEYLERFRTKEQTRYQELVNHLRFRKGK